MLKMSVRPSSGKGWLPDIPDYRDRRYGAHRPVRSAQELPEIVDLIENQSPIRDQGQEGSCVGHAVAAGVDYLRRTDDDKVSTIYSPRWPYWKARELQGWTGEDSGAFIRDAIKAIVKEGICPESCYKYVPGQFTKRPTMTAIKQAPRWKLGQYLRADNLLQILNALAEGHPVPGGFACFSNMWSPEVDRTGVLPLPGGSSDSGHAVLFMGYHRPRQLLKFKNSWADWGEGGYGWLPFVFPEQGLSDDHWAMLKEA